VRWASSSEVVLWRWLEESWFDFADFAVLSADLDEDKL
jgi:hypothetical protein